MGSITIRNIDTDLKREFKIACLVKDQTMSEVLITMMKEYIKTSGKSAKAGKT